MDDILDYEAGENTLGKPGGADLRLGLATGPALYAWEEHEALGPLIHRKFEQEGDVEIVSNSQTSYFFIQFIICTGPGPCSKIFRRRTDA